MMAAMSQDLALHQFHRHPALPWAELRVSRQSCHSYRLHAHAQYSIGIVDEGETLFHHDQGPDRVQTGGVVLIEPGHWHACNPEVTQPWSYRMLFVQADWVHARLGVDALRFGQRSLQEAVMSACVNALCTPWAVDTDAQSLEVYAQTLLSLLQQVGTPACADAQLPPVQQDIFPALQHLHQFPEDETTVQALAQTCGMSASRFIRHFRSLTGVTPGVYRTNLRLNGARHLLAQGQTLADVALHMGFADQAHLQRSFKAHHALTPGNYARNSASTAASPGRSFAARQ